MVSEKDEAIESKHRIWREMHQTIQEKDARIAELPAGTAMKSENRHLKRRVEELFGENKRLQQRVGELEQALRQTLATDESDEEDDQDDTKAAEVAVRTDSARPYSVSRPDSLTAGRQTPNEHASRAASRTANPAQFTHFIIQSLPTERFSVHPLIESFDNEMPSFGQLSELAPSLLQAIQATLDGMQHCPIFYNAT